MYQTGFFGDELSGAVSLKPFLKEKNLMRIFMVTGTIFLMTLASVWADERYMRDTDLPGGDYQHFEMPRHADAGNCADACRDDRRCRAWTFVERRHGEKAHCWLKEFVPDGRRNSRCVSGVVQRRRPHPPRPRPAGRIEYGVDRPGEDYYNFDLDKNAAPEQCADACRNDDHCRSWTYIKRGKGKHRPRCCLKDGVPRAERNDDCISGVVR